MLDRFYTIINASDIITSLKLINTRNTTILGGRKFDGTFIEQGKSLNEGNIVAVLETKLFTCDPTDTGKDQPNINSWMQQPERSDVSGCLTNLSFL